MSTATRDTEHDQLTTQDRAHIDTYETARRHHQPVCLAAQPQAGAGPRLYDVNTALTRWWALIEQLDRRLPRNPATRAYLDSERATWFRCRQTLLFACSDQLVRNAMLEPVTRPEEPRGGAVSDVGRFGYFALDERLTITEPIHITVRVDPSGTVSLVNP